MERRIIWQPCRLIPHVHGVVRVQVSKVSSDADHSRVQCRDDAQDHGENDSSSSGSITGFSFRRKLHILFESGRCWYELLVFAGAGLSLIFQEPTFTFMPLFEICFWKGSITVMGLPAIKSVLRVAVEGTWTHSAPPPPYCCPYPCPYCTLTCLTAGDQRSGIQLWQNGPDICARPAGHVRCALRTDSFQNRESTRTALSARATATNVQKRW